MTPKPNKAGLVYLLRARGYDVPSVRAADFEALWQGMALGWRDRSGQSCTAYLHLSAVPPMLQVGRITEFVPRDELERFDLLEQERSPDAAEADVEAHEDIIMIPQFAELCKG